MTAVGLQDWDAFQSDLQIPGAAAMHAASRAISGGPVYTSDKPDKHVSEIIRRLAFADGAVPR
jgi:Raffinose synthase or seed imbibition protein Sip1